MSSVTFLSCVPQTLLTQREAPQNLWPSFQGLIRVGGLRWHRGRSRGSMEALRARRASTRGRHPCRPRCHWPSPCPRATTVGERWSTPAGCLLPPTAPSRCLLKAETRETQVPGGCSPLPIWAAFWWLWQAQRGWSRSKSKRVAP